jgi:hypothetical protein
VIPTLIAGNGTKVFLEINDIQCVRAWVYYYYEGVKIRRDGLFYLCRQKRLVGHQGTSLRRRLRRRGQGDRVSVCGF